jgi:hypothetical protein
LGNEVERALAPIRLGDLEPSALEASGQNRAVVGDVIDDEKARLGELLFSQLGWVAGRQHREPSGSGCRHDLFNRRKQA